MTFEELGLAAPILEAVKDCGYETPTPIQQQAIPVVLEGKDVIGASQTGTGKSAAFALPLLTRIEANGLPQVLVLEPTRELADQLAEAFRTYAKHTDIKVALLYGGIGYGKQTEELQKGAEVVIATPGRLVDHFYRGNMKFKTIRHLVLDEVDRMTDMGFLPIVRKIINLCPWEGRQTLFFSATMPQILQGFAKWCLTDPVEVAIARSEVAATISHAFYPVGLDQRDELLLALVKNTDFRNLMVFTRTRKEADAVSNMLSNAGWGKEVTVMHSDIPQKERMAALRGFKEDKYRILVATDVAARGIDVNGVTHVINYRVPENPEDYVHRIGRTGRAEAQGDAFTLLTADEVDFAKSVELFIKQKVERRKLEGFDYAYTALLDEGARPIRKPRPAAPKRRRR
ncbi:MAG: DEAD/DEAH box helicase [Akkermansia sp.]|nr:DEAD/DEAH box helicase [Akkermansia sp.]MBR1998489.1 DEAD/DEAH box helicase [Akkermansia sp.]MBR3696459.1 DEAD/DEAH box helicase [Akkermansia sp.]MBR3944340.1 DEAD/DEAH box helicase [Akkermansia sp.]